MYREEWWKWRCIERSGGSGDVQRGGVMEVEMCRGEEWSIMCREENGRMSEREGGA